MNQQNTNTAAADLAATAQPVLTQAPSISIMGAKEMQTSNPLDLPDEAISLGPIHKPIGHRTGVLAQIDAIDYVGLDILEQVHVVDGVRNMQGHGNYGDITIPGANIFSLFKVAPRSGSALAAAPAGQDYLIGYRNSVAQAIARQACIGFNFTVCTNVSLFGQDIIYKAKSTLHAEISVREVMATRVLPMLESAEQQVERVRSVTLTRVQREATMFRMFERKALPTKMLPALGAAAVNEEYPEVQEEAGNALGLMHAATRVIQGEKSMRRQAELSQSISRFFRFGTDEVASI